MPFRIREHGYGAPGARKPGGTPLTPTQVRVELPDEPYTIHLAAGLLDRLGEVVPAPGRTQGAAVIADETTAELFANRALASLREFGWDPHALAVAPGEDSKTLDTAARLYPELAAAGLDRGSVVFALGGGVVGDLAGFVAATYMRGIGFVPVPTTLLAQVDSSVGGKVAVDLPRGKNLVGAFHQPRAVVIDPETLGSLPGRECAAGLAEVVKHAAIASAELFDRLTRESPQVVARESALLGDVVAANCRIKAGVVSQDPQERTGRRAVLNFGHTLGHAIERGAAHWGVRHGEAVALGMLAEAQAAVRLGLAAAAVPRRLAELLKALGVPTELPPGAVDLDLALTALRSDKKIVGGVLSLPVVPEIGVVQVTDSVPIDELAAELDHLLH